jgi:surface antigen
MIEQAFTHAAFATGSAPSERPHRRRRWPAFLVAVLVASWAVVLGASSATAAEQDCKSSAYACTPDYTGSNASSTWAWTYYGHKWATTPTGYHNCTLYVAWRLARNGMKDPGRSWGNAVDWKNSIGGGNKTPAVGSVAWWGGHRANGFGHVAYVEQVSGDKVFVRADNWIETGGYTSSGWIPASSVDLFLHPHDVAGGGGSGQPLDIKNLPDRTLIQESGTPAVYVMAGGAKFGIPSPAELEALGYNFGQVNVLPAGTLATIPNVARDRTLVQNRGDGGVYVMAGGAKFGIPSPAELEALGYNFGQVNVLPAGTLQGVPDVPRDGTLLRERTSSAVFIVEGGKRTETTAADPGLVQVVPDGSLAQVPTPTLTPAPEPAPTTEPAPTPAPVARDIASTCDSRQTSGFTDSPGTTHAYAINCVNSWAIAKGKTATVFDPGGPLTGGQTATFLVRTLQAAGVQLPEPADLCAEDADVHATNIERLMSMNVITWRPADRVCNPGAVMSRELMAEWTRNALASAGVRGDAGTNWYSDDDSSSYATAIDEITDLGIVTGKGGAIYGPSEGLIRGQMATFLARTLDALIER